MPIKILVWITAGRINCHINESPIMASYLIVGKNVREDEPQFQVLLGTAYGKKPRPLCLCQNPGVEMYVTKLAGRHIIKRMPGTGGDHAPTCDSYEPPAELSGLGEINDNAIQENPDLGVTSLKFDFALTKGAGRSAPIPSGAEAGSVKADGRKLTLRSTLHYLWVEAGFNKWSPSMHGKRNWFVIRKYLLQAAENKIAKGVNLAEILYVPESFSVEKKDEITHRRLAQMMKVATSQKGTKRLMLVIAEVKEIAPSRYGHKIVMKHLPDYSFMLNDELHKQLFKRFGNDIDLAFMDESKNHLIAIATFSIGSTGVASIEEIALMPVSENWIPFETIYDKTLIDMLMRGERRFVKGMRYNLASNRPLACVVLADTVKPVAMYIVPPGATDDYITTLESLISDSKLESWVWRVEVGTMPGIPEPV